jgi:predicted RNA binding protein YcfA (HicA-like mRNA interferase family)
MSSRAQVMDLLKVLKKQGFDYERTGSGHWKVTYPGRPGSVIIGFSPNNKGMHLTIKRLKKLGYRP